MSITAICPQCQSEFIQNKYKSLHKTYCSILCRNKANASLKVAEKRKTCPVCGTTGYRKTEFCIAHAPPVKRPRTWTAETDSILLARYATEGAQTLASELNITPRAVSLRAGRLGLKVSPDAMKVLVHAKASAYMTANNPMRDKKVRDKVALWWANNPEVRDRVYAALSAGQQSYQRRNPSSCERLLHAILIALMVDFEASAEIKPGVIVDARIGNLIIQVDGDYWHGHPRYEPLSERQQKQRARDTSITKYLETCGYVVIRIWESDLTPDFLRDALLTVRPA